MDHSYWTTTEQRGENTPRGSQQEALGQPMKSQTEREGMRVRKRGRDRTSQSKLSWSLTITSHTFPPPPPPYTFLFSKFCFLCFLLWPAAVEASVKHHCFFPLFFFSNFLCISLCSPYQSTQTKWSSPPSNPPANQSGAYSQAAGKTVEVAFAASQGWLCSLQVLPW